MVGEKGPMVYLASEQAAIEVVCPDAENVRSIEGGVPFVVQLDDVARQRLSESSENNPFERPFAHETGVMPKGRKEACQHA